ncbi:DUF350 domain-containing protein [Psychrobium sp. 1_MG-2023]|uniref:DUF350 domain-containing protein n=1 Tax=Psychrobium sp. 1_MG-2023 TaxID=3062624 RepID=UPI000C33E849|nr:DUF350 domain-containing protein [Psychrobium sp. 1_MG-2023]MDP2561622.1 DUF350 domain-containing protein [Psychrobium sp. 1_MG-2023]PKF55641.1 DUF350 domain-containing protein [Alteromonadales bacterium alter-6D02]
MDLSITAYLSNLTFIVMFLVVIFAAKWLYNLTTSYNTFEQITEHKNLALSTSIMGFVSANTIIYVSMLIGPSHGLKADVFNVGMYTLLGMGLLLVSRFINDKVLLHSFCNSNQLIEKQNMSVGLAQAASYITSGLIIGGALMGEGSFISALAFYALGQVLLIVFTKFYDIFTKFKLLTELEKNNIAAATSFSATVIAIGIILLHALAGEFVSWQSSLTLFFIDALIAFAALPLVRILIDKLLFPSINIDNAIEQEQNIAVALLEGAIAISVALVIFFAL